MFLERSVKWEYWKWGKRWQGWAISIIWFIVCTIFWKTKICPCPAPSMPSFMTKYCLVLNKFGAVLSLDFAATTESFKQMPQFCSKCRISFCVQPPICLMSRERLSLDTNFVYFFYLIMTLFEIYPKMTQNRQTWSGHIGGERFSFLKHLVHIGLCKPLIKRTNGREMNGSKNVKYS